MDSDEAVRLRIILDDNPNGQNKVVRKPADVLDGRLELVCGMGARIGKVTVYFEGVSRNWITDMMGGQEGVMATRVERRSKFLNQAQDIPLSTISQTSSLVEEPCYSVPFHFIISRQLASSDPDAPEHCLQLPPSLELGDIFVDEATGRRFAQPSITYHLRAIAELISGEGLSKAVEASIPVLVIASTEEFPPTETGDFPSEFKEIESKIIRTSLTSRTLGTMTISIQEPPALKYDLLSSQSSTKGLLKIEFESANSREAYSSLQGMTFTLYSLIRVKTFYSVKSFPRLPSQSLLSLRGQTRLRDDIIKLGAGSVSISWGYRYNMSSGLFLSSTGESQEHLAKDISARVSGPSPTYTHLPDGKWTADIDVPIRVNTRLIPTFCTSLVARVYSIVLRLHISGARCEPFDFEVPLQVVHIPNDSHRISVGHMQGVPATEPMSEDQTLRAARRSSETSWFSDLSLESDEQPPDYYL